MDEEAGERSVLERIQLCAAAVLEALADVEEINILRMAEYLGEGSALTYQALGWLAREGRVRYRRSGSQVFVALAEEHKAKRGDKNQ
jgi:hypothetical protein